VQELDPLANRGAAAVHRTDLHEALVLVRGVDHLTAFPHRVGCRLFDEHVLAGLETPDGRERMPVIRRRHDDRVDVLVVQHAPEILHEARLERRHVRQPLVVDPRGREVRIDVAERLDFHVCKPGEAALERIALAANADAGEDHAVVGPDDTPAHDRRSAGMRAHELASGHQASGRSEA
jgi:hypothetical protein